MNGCIYRTQSDLCKLYTKDDTISFCKREDCPDRKQSNADRIRSMTDEELAEMFIRIQYDVAHYVSNANANLQFPSSPGLWLNWLKKEAKGETE